MRRGRVMKSELFSWIMILTTFSKKNYLTETFAIFFHSGLKIKAHEKSYDKTASVKSVNSLNPKHMLSNILGFGNLEKQLAGFLLAAKKFYGNCMVHGQFDCLRNIDSRVLWFLISRTLYSIV